MRKSELEHMIRDNIRKIVPSDVPKFDLKTLVPPQDESAFNHLNRFPWVTRRSLALLMSLVVVVLLVFTVDFGISLITTTQTPTSSTTQSDQTTSSVILNPITEINAKEYANPIITASKLSSSLVSSGIFTLTHQLGQEPLKMDDHIDLVNQYMNALETTLSYVQTMVVTLESDREGYAYRVQTSSFDILDISEVYEMYYNVTKQDDDKTLMVGIVIWDGKTSNFIGEFEEEGDEEKLIITAYDTDELGDEYIRTEFKIEDEEQSYRIEVFDEGEMIAASNIKIEIEADESKIQVELITGENTIQFEIKKEFEDEGYAIKITYGIEDTSGSESGMMKVEVFFDEVQSKYYYIYHVTSGDISKTYEQDRIISTTPEVLPQVYSDY